MRDMDLTSLAPEELPVTIRAYKRGTDKRVWEKVVRCPSVVHIPPVMHEHGHVWIQLRYGNGETYEIGKGRFSQALMWLTNKLVRR